MSAVREAGPGHGVLFAESDDELVGLAADGVAAALAAGGSSIVIATPEHHAAFDERMAASGVDPATARADGSLLTLDAEATLARLTPRGAFSSSAFGDVLGSLVRDTRTRGPVHAFGEMVALLWDDDRAQEAIALEAAWDGLIRETTASLLCAYPGRLVDEPHRTSELASVCGLHSAVVSDREFRRSWQLSGDPQGMSEGRRLLANALRARGVSEQAFYDTLAVATELMANAVAHARSAFTLGVAVDSSRVLVQVHDGSAAVPVVRRDDPRLEAGRGMVLVDELATRWGVERYPSEKAVWAELGR